ncbi:MAG TPA: hypothetical protein VHF25_06470 [Nitriliruptorales bacterium]|nr:hypothetical protein [Nitriliruptorales bacterium]
MFAGGHAQRAEQVGLAGAGATEQDHGFAAVDAGAVGQRRDAGGRDGGGGVEVEPRQGLEPGEPGFLDAAFAPPDVAGVDLGGQQLGQVGPV